MRITDWKSLIVKLSSDVYICAGGGSAFDTDKLPSGVYVCIGGKAY